MQFLIALIVMLIISLIGVGVHFNCREWEREFRSRYRRFQTGVPLDLRKQKRAKDKWVFTNRAVDKRVLGRKSNHKRF